MGCQGRLLELRGRIIQRKKEPMQRSRGRKKLENVGKSTRPEWMKGRDRRKGWETTLTQI